MSPIRQINAPIRVTPTDPDNTDRSTADTIHQMTVIAQDSASLPAIREITASILLSLGPNPSPTSVIDSLFHFVKNHMKFVEDETNAMGLLGLGPDKELLFTPHYLLTINNPTGDCDDYSTLLATLILASGIDCEVYFVTVAVDKNEPNRWSHVYCMVKLENKVIPLDASHGPYIGWETQTHYRKQYWLVGKNKEKKGEGMRGLGVDDTWSIDFPSTSASSGFEWGDLVSSGWNTAQKILTAQYGGVQPGEYFQQTKEGGVVNYRLPSGSASASFSTLPNISGEGSDLIKWVLLGGAVIIGVKLLGGRK